MSGRSASLIVPERVAANCRNTPEAVAWLARLPDAVRGLAQRWSLTLGRPFDGPEVSAAWVAPARRADGTAAVLKLGMPHMEAEHEIDGLRFWDGRPTVRLLEADDDLGAMLLERCEPGTPLRSLPEVEQDVIVAGLLRRLWRVPDQLHPFRPLSEMIDLWIEETRANEARWTDPGLVLEGLDVFEELARGADPVDGVLLATDLHAGNVLRAEREPWLVIDPKPFVGDLTYDATQHLLNCEARLRDAPHGTIARFADLLEVDGERVRLWTFARAAAESRDEWDDSWRELARTLGP
jgi:streptomycin 6-kinase